MNSYHNYQLYRTNVKLGGQVSWNLVLEDTNTNELYIKYFDLTPISPNVNYKYGQNTNCLQYSHSENLRELYKQIKGQFYNACINPRLETIYPIIDSEMIDTRDASLEMGCSRISFNRYNKQLQAFCPLWLENFSNTDTLSFDISVYIRKPSLETGEIENTILSTKRLVLEPKNIPYHDKFVSYLNNYIKEIAGDDVIGDDILNVKIVNKFASINGLNINTGKVVSKDISTLVPNLFDRERPLMETDYMLIDNFHTSEMIAKQLFNFNLVFDLSDIVSNVMNNMMSDDEFYIKVDVNINNKPLEKRSFNCNYSSLKRTNENYTFEEENYEFTYFGDVLNYLHDDRCIDTIRDNKLEPDICHWTLNDNDEYIFNLYPGFGTTYPMFYKDSPNYWETDATKYPNSLTWVNYSEVDNLANGLQLMYSNIKFTEFNLNNKFFKDTKFDIYDNETSDDITDNTEYLYSFSTKDVSSVQDILINLRNNGITNYIFICPDPNDSTKFIHYVPDTKVISGNDDYKSILDNQNITNFMVLFHTQLRNQYMVFADNNNKNLLTFKWLSRAISDLKMYKFHSEGFTDYKLSTIKSIIKKIIYPEFIYIYNSLGIKKADSPWTNTNEIYFVKVNNKSNIVIRYDGKIKPMFSKFDDLVWYRVRKMSPDEFTHDKAFESTQTQGYLPNYPSVEYFNLEYVDKTNYQPLNEYKWFEHSNIYNLRKNIEVKIYSRLLNRYYNSEELVYKVLNDTYPSLMENHSTYIRSLYYSDVSYEYDTIPYDKQTEKFNYVYTVKLDLK